MDSYAPGLIAGFVRGGIRVKRKQHTDKKKKEKKCLQRCDYKLYWYAFGSPLDPGPRPVCARRASYIFLFVRVALVGCRLRAPSSIDRFLKVFLGRFVKTSKMKTNHSNVSLIAFCRTSIILW